jgi:glycosyltransferase involved in cell wall biosynthesis
MISVIIPVYNVEPYLRKCLDSVLNQSYRDLEILIVDDGSTDGSGKVCDEYRNDERVRVFHTENRGLSAARNYALDRSHGDYIAFIDSDDWFEVTALQTFLTNAQETGADIVACQFYQEYVDKTVRPSGFDTEFVAKGDEVLKVMVIDHKLTEDVWNKFYRASLFEGIRYPEGLIFEDKATTYKLLQKSQVLAYTPTPLIHYRNREGSLSNVHSMKSLVDYWTVYRERFDTLSPISDQYYRTALSEAVGAISRMWRWYAGCSKEGHREAEKTLEEMQRFLEEHRREVIHGPYSGHVKATCWYARNNPLVFKLLYSMNTLYRNRNRNKYFD